MSDGGASRTQPTDEIEAGMEVRGRVLHREKLVARGLALTMALCTLLFGAAAVVFALGHGAGVPLISRVLTFVLLPLFPIAGLLRSVVRTLVTTDAVQVLWGLWGPRIPLSAITRCEVWTAERIRTEAGARRTGYQLLAPGSFSEAVWIEWTDEEGAPQRAVVGSQAPALLVAAIEGARLARGLRVKAADEAEIEGEEEDAAAEVRRARG